MSRQAERATLLLLYTLGVGLASAGMAPLFGNNPVVMLPVGALVGWITVMTYLAITETKR